MQGYGKRLRISDIPVQRRTGRGRVAVKFHSPDDSLVALHVVRVWLC